MKLTKIVEQATVFRKQGSAVRLFNIEEEVEFYRAVLMDIAMGRGNPSAKAHAALEARD